MTNMTSIPRRLIDKLLRKMNSLVAETVELFKENADVDGLTPKLKEWIARHHIEGWAEAYEDFNNFLLAHLAALPALGNSLPVIPQLDEVATTDDIQRWADSVWEACESVLDDDSDEWIDEIVDGPPEPLGENIIDDQGRQITRPAVFGAVAIIISLNYFACMVHRKSMFQLVAEAKAGDDESLLKAVQIDKRCLTDIVYFRERVAKSVLHGDDNFLRRVAQHRKKPTFQSGTKLHPLYPIFSLLDSIGVLEAYTEDLERFADLCQSLGAYGPEDDAVDLDNFARTLRRFKADYRTLGPPKEKRLFVKDTD